MRLQARAHGSLCGVVTLRGFVGNAESQHTADQIASDVQGFTTGAACRF